MKITDVHLRDVCKPGQGPVTCRYITCGAGGFECAKHEPGIAGLLDRRAEAGTINARGDNCSGLEADMTSGLDS